MLNRLTRRADSENRENKGSRSDEEMIFKIMQQDSSVAFLVVMIGIHNEQIEFNQTKLSWQGYPISYGRTGKSGSMKNSGSATLDIMPTTKTT